MSLVNIDSVQRQALHMLSRMEAPAGLELSSYKRNRSVSVAILSEEQVTVREKGYMEQELNADMKELPRLLKTMIKREFPRSRKVRLHKFSGPAELDRLRKIL